MNKRKTSTNRKNGILFILAFFLSAITTSNWVLNAVDPVTMENKTQLVLPELPRIKVDTDLKLDVKWLKAELAKPKEERDSRFKYPTRDMRFPNLERYDLTTFLDKHVQRGDIVVLEAGKVYGGTVFAPDTDDQGKQLQVNLPKKDGEDYIYLISSAYADLPAEGIRITADDRMNMPKIMNSARPRYNVMAVNQGAGYYRFIGVEFSTPEIEGEDGYGTGGGIISLQPSGIESSELLNVLAERFNEVVCRNIIFDRCYIHGTRYSKVEPRGVWINGARNIGFVDCRFDRILRDDNDNQCIGGSNFLGLKIQNCYLEAACENIIFGANGAALPEYIAGDVEIIGNHFYKPDEWNRFVGASGDPAFPGKKVWRCKNLFELKSAQRMLVDGNIFENNWKDSDQWGYGILFTLRTSNNRFPLKTIKDITFTNNIIKNSSGGFQIAGLDDGDAGVPAENILIQNNLIMINNYSTDFHSRPYNDGNPSGDPAEKKEPFQIQRNVINLIIDHNTIITGGSYKVSNIMGSKGIGSYPGFRYTNNISTTPVLNKDGKKYGLLVGREGEINTLSGDGIIFGNIFAGLSDRSTLYPNGNYFPIEDNTIMFNDYANEDYRLATNSPFRDASLSTDGKIPGADIELIYKKTKGVAFYDDEGWSIIESLLPDLHVMQETLVRKESKRSKVKTNNMVTIPYGETSGAKETLKLYCDWLMGERNETGFFNVFEGDEQMYEWYMIMYPVRALLVGGELLNNTKYIEAAFYYLDLYVSEQLPNGAFTSNYRQRKGTDLTQDEMEDILRYGKVNLADNGSNVAALIQACKYAGRERREKYLSAAKKWFDNWVTIWRFDSGAYGNGIWEGHKMNSPYSTAIGTVSAALSMYGIVTGDASYIKKAEDAIRFQCNNWTNEHNGNPKFFTCYPEPKVIESMNDFGHSFYTMEGMVWTHKASQDKALKALIEKRLKDWNFGRRGLLSQWSGNWFNFLCYPGSQNETRSHGIRLGWEMAKSNAFPSLWMYYLENIDDDARLRLVVEKAYTHLCTPLDARMSGVMSDPRKTYGSFAVQSTGFAAMSLAEKIKPGSLYNLK